MGRGRGSGLQPGDGSGPGRPAGHAAFSDPEAVFHQSGGGGGPRVDPVAGRAECERLVPQLGRIMLPVNGVSGSAADWGDWHSRWQSFKSGAVGISTASPEAVAVLGKSSSGVADELDRIAAAERRWKSGSEAMLVQYRAARQRLEGLQVCG